MPQARLIDINTAAIKYRNIAHASFNGRKYPNCYFAVYTLNGLLPEKYRVKVSTQEYEKLTHLDIKVKCPRCEDEHDYHQIKQFDILLPLDGQIILQRPRQKVWVCSHCRQLNKISGDYMIQPKLAEPHFLKVIPAVPIRRQGLADRTRYHNVFSTWFGLAMKEIEAQIANFRDDNWNKGDNEMFEIDTDLENSGEELDE